MTIKPAALPSARAFAHYFANDFKRSNAASHQS